LIDNHHQILPSCNKGYFKHHLIHTLVGFNVTKDISKYTPSPSNFHLNYEAGYFQSPTLIKKASIFTMKSNYNLLNFLWHFIKCTTISSSLIHQLLHISSNTKKTQFHHALYTHRHRTLKISILKQSWALCETVLLQQRKLQRYLSFSIG